MLLPELTIPALIDLIDTNFVDFFFKYVSNDDSPKLTFKRSNISYNGYRYSIYFDEEKPNTSQQFLIGEINVIKVHNNRTDIRAAVYLIQDIKDGLRFFDDFYFMIFTKWEIEITAELLNCKKGEGATMEWVEIGWHTGYFCLPDVYSKMFYEHDCYDDFLKYAPNDLEIYDFLHDSAVEKIKQKYEFEINKRLSRYSDVELSHEQMESLNQEDGFGRCEENIEESSNPWEIIPDKGNDRLIVERWCNSDTAKAIANDLNLSPRTVYDRLRIIRRDNKDIKIPYHQKWRNKPNNS